ncbi:hypothetical protein SAMN05421870_11265 [Streptomyces qinglanensis]|uniref:Uncharacterized protein n=1 Tax=Streptomyces qinglanensis TaxID=943816 RepID=A0A1H9VJP9_9ACTN|nr:hypothetical protein SAMN05421870_11265 [Streptomyces qinglanensis]
MVEADETGARCTGAGSAGPRRRERYRAVRAPRAAPVEGPDGGCGCYSGCVRLAAAARTTAGPGCRTARTAAVRSTR